MSIVRIIDVCSSPKSKTLSKPEPVQTGIKVCPQGIPVWTGFTVQCFRENMINNVAADSGCHGEIGCLCGENHCHGYTSMENQ